MGCKILFGDSEATLENGAIYLLLGTPAIESQEDDDALQNQLEKRKGR